MAEAARPRRTPRAVLARAGRDPLLRSAYSLMLNVVLTSGSGVLFWIAAARMFPSATVGRDSALIAAMMVSYMVCSLNLGAAVLRFLPVVRLPVQRVVLGAYAVTAGVSLIGGTGFVVLAPRISGDYAFLSDSPLLAVAYVAAVTLWGIFALQDSVLTALHRAPWVPIENGIFGALKLAALPLLLAAGSGHPVFIAWVIPMALLLIPVNYLIFCRVLRERTGPATDAASPIERFGRRGLLRFLAQDYAASIFMQLGTQAMPALLVALLGASTSAHFYMPFTIVAAFDLLFLNVASSLTVQAATAEHRTPELVRTVIRRFGPVMLGGVLVLVVGADVVLLPFGHEYVQHGAAVLRLLATASIFRGVVALFSAVCRIEGRTAPILAVQAATFAMTLGGTLVLAPMWGLTGVGLAWLGSNAVAALGAAPRVVRVLGGDRVAAAVADLAAVAGTR